MIDSKPKLRWFQFSQGGMHKQAAWCETVLDQGEDSFLRMGKRSKG